MRKFQNLIFSVIARNNYAIYPPPEKSITYKFRKNLIASAVTFAFSTLTVCAATGDVIDKNFLENDGDNGDFTEYRTDIKESGVYDSINLPDFNPPSDQNQFAVRVLNDAEVTITGKTYIDSYTNWGSNKPEGTLAITAGNKHGNASTGIIHLLGDVEIYVVHDDTQASYGANAVYSTVDGSLIELGSENTKTVIWSIAKKPDAISAKLGAEVKFSSKRNQLIGNIDTLDTDFGTKGSKVSGIFSGSDSYWFGDEQTFQNIKNIEITASIPVFGSISMELKGTADIEKLLELDYVDLIVDKRISELLKKHPEYKDPVDIKIKDILTTLGISEKTEVTDSVDLIFENGAQWTYFGDEQQLHSQIGQNTATFTSTPKRISTITLNGGIVNLYDEDIQNTWASITHNGETLIELWPELESLEHDYVRIGKLKGNGGIFRLDLNSDKPSQSDMIFIESSEPEEPGQHFIEPYRPEDLTSVSDTNRLTFALTAKDANSVSFADKQNIYGNSLFDYELIIDHETITINEDDKELIGKINEELVGIYKDFDDFNIKDYNGGTHWYIKRLLTKESAASIGMRSAGYASYDLAVNMDRRDRRLQNAVFQNEEKDGLWARVQYGEAGAEHLYNADLTTVYVGYEKAISVDNRLGFSFAYTDGESDLNDLKGSGDLKRYEASVYDTLTFGSHYLDFVARFGQVDNEFDVTNQSGALTTSGSFDQKYAALSAEYGYNFKDEHNVFIEPQVQLQVAYLGDYNYRTERNMKVDADSDISVIGRVGLRTGKTFESSDYVGELYARADVLHQFTDGQDAQFSDLSDKVNVTWGNKDTWSTFGVGGYLNWKDNISFQVDVERTAGGETIDTWLVSGRVNYLF